MTYHNTRRPSWRVFSPNQPQKPAVARGCSLAGVIVCLAAVLALLLFFLLVRVLLGGRRAARWDGSFG